MSSDRAKRRETSNTKTKTTTMTKEQQIETLSDILNESKVFDSYAIRTGIKLNNDSDIWSEIEEFIVDKINEDTN